MDFESKMGAFCGAAQSNYDDACVAFSAANKCAPIERETGVKKLADKLNPEQPHKLSVMDVKLITRASGDYTIVNSLLYSLDMVAVAVDKNGEPETFVKRTLDNSIYAGELAQEALKHAGQKRMTGRSKNTIVKKAHTAIGNLILLINDMEGRTPNASSFLSMGMDLLSSGVTVPGLA
ncbi:phage regulatory CII family protein [Aliivibrio sp. S4MY4]|uniref:phage regulatory CII family protein n=1 Tax=unclassified Aliivibrio TaxID=2645654 RepID=UPI00237813D7|nr:MULTISPECIES: phage regulatory CII family protein [unclassified Aliivibrio]MDD9162981.1 phage regulatory CII family protein [Aliivibrio sp. S4MY2]MDD9166658.1 phage regulatory CII family protein [Aliivibrio sp. S4MY4]MDD9184058.1 phage regulatory CII family protein [Aliivibrio sp. S4MY3]MDD9200965.1 phage regulatory CII family protein [Aliivibrio sp. S4MY1]